MNAADSGYISSGQDQYVAQHITPTLSRAIVELCKARPADPVTFLAHTLRALKSECEDAPRVEGITTTDVLDIHSICHVDMRKASMCVDVLLDLRSDCGKVEADEIAGGCLAAARAISNNLEIKTMLQRSQVCDKLMNLRPFRAWLPTLARLMPLIAAKADGWTFASDGTSGAPSLPAKDEMALNGAAQTALRTLSFIAKLPNLTDGETIHGMRRRIFVSGSKVGIRSGPGGERPTAIVTAGPPGAGKSHLLSKVLPWLQTACGAPPADHFARIDPDMWITELCNNNNADRGLANYCNHETFVSAVRQRRHLMFDATGRQLVNTCGRVIGRLERANYRIHLIIVLATRETCWKRIEARRAATGRAVPGFVFNPTFDDMCTVVPVYLRGPHSGLCETTTFCDNEPSGKPKSAGGGGNFVSLTRRSSPEEVEAVVETAEGLLGMRS